MDGLGNVEGLGTELQQVDLDSLVSIATSDLSKKSISYKILQSDPCRRVTDFGSCVPTFGGG